MVTYAEPLTSLGYVYKAENPDRSKRAFRWPPGQRRTHLYARAAGSFDEQLNLLFRDFLRGRPGEAETYARVKRELALQFRDDRPGYVAAKEPTIWALIQQAHTWMQEIGWSPGPTDA